jgi:hypothetical protein
MHKITRLPLYLGASVLVFSVLFSVVKLGEQVSISSNSVKATSATANLTLNFVSPDKISLMLTADKPVAGIDAVISFDKNKIMVLPSTLKGSNVFTASGGVVDKNEGNLSFAAIASKPEVTSGIVATFNVSPKQGKNIEKTSLILLTGINQTNVIEKNSGEKMLLKVSNVEFSLNP